MGGTVAGEVGVPVCEGKFLQGDLSMVNRPLDIVTAALKAQAFSSSSSSSSNHGAYKSSSPKSPKDNKKTKTGASEDASEGASEDKNEA